VTDENTFDAPVAARSNPWWSIAGGAIFAVTALVAAPLAGLEISSDLSNSSGHTTWLTLVVGVFLVGATFTWLVMSRAQLFSAARGAATGILTALFSYPIVITLSELLHRNGQGPPPLHERMDSVVLVTALTLMTTGFATTLIAAVVGAAAAGLLVLLHPPTGAGAKLRARKEWQASRRSAPGGRRSCDARDRRAGWILFLAHDEAARYQSARRSRTSRRRRNDIRRRSRYLPQSSS
jgi:hypothetical protein